MLRPGVAAAFGLLLVSGLVDAETTTPLRLLSITPSEPTQQFELFFTQSLTVTFSRPVVAFGSDFDVDVAGPQPFSLICADQQPCNISGTLRWVTTSIGRFTPTKQWPTDLAFDLVVDPDLMAFDGMKLTTDETQVLTQRYVTPSLTISVTQVQSNKSSELTNNRWQSTVPYQFLSQPLNGAVHEVPPDGVIFLQFSYPVDLELLGRTLQLVPRCVPGETCTPIATNVATCPANEQSGPTWPMYAATPQMKFSDDTEVGGETCVRVTPVQPLAANTTYALGLAAGSRYSTVAGFTRNTTTVTVTGLLPFWIPMRSPVMGNYRRFRFGLRHSVEPSVTDAMLAEVVQVSPIPEGGITVHQVAPSVMEIEGNFTPTRNYTLTIQASSSILDGYGQPLLGSQATITMVELGARVIYGNFNGGRTESWFEEGFGNDRGAAPQQDVAVTGWGVLTVNIDLARCGGTTGQKKVVGTAVTTDNLDALIRASHTQFVALDVANSTAVPPTQEILLTPASTNDGESVQYDELSAEALLGPSGLAMVQYWENMYEDRTGQCHWWPSTQWLSSSDINPVFVDHPNKIIAWITSLTDGSPMVNATVLVYQTAEGSDGNSKTELVARSTTDRSGLATLPVVVKDYSTTLDAFVIYNGTVAHTTVFAWPQMERSEMAGALVTDRRLYKRGDTVHIKGYVRQHTDEGVTVPTSPELVLRIYWTDPTEQEDIPVTFGSEYGDFNATLVVPANATVQSHQLTLICLNCDRTQFSSTGPYEIAVEEPEVQVVPEMDVDSDVEAVTNVGVAANMRQMSASDLTKAPAEDLYEADAMDLATRQRQQFTPSLAVEMVDTTWGQRAPGTVVAITSLLVADPRIPTGVVTLVPSTSFYRPNQQLQLTINTTTYTGSPVTNAKVTIQWSCPILRILDPNLPVSADDAKGEMEVVTGDDGRAVATLTLSNAEQFVGSTLRILARWVGPTGELIQDSAQLHVAYTDLRLAVTPTNYSPLPGTKLAFFVTVIEEKGGPLADHPVTVTVYRYNSSTPLVEQAPRGAVSGVGAAILTRSCVAKGNHAPICQITTPKTVGSFAVVLSATDAEGYVTFSTVVIGKTEEEWQNEPLSKFPVPTLVGGQDSYSIGERATLMFYNYFRNAELLVVWGNREKTHTGLAKVTAPGMVSVPVPLGQECAGGCQAAVALVAPLRNASDVVLPEGVVVSPLMDLEGAAAFTFETTLNVVDPAKELTVSVSTPEDTIAPGTTTALQVKVNHKDGRPAAGTVCVAVVNKAYLDLAAMDVVNLSAIMNPYIYMSLVVTAPIRQLASIVGYARARDIIMRRLARDPYVDVSWPIMDGEYPNTIAWSDERFFSYFFTALSDGFDLFTGSTQYLFLMRPTTELFGAAPAMEEPTTQMVEDGATLFETAVAESGAGGGSSSRKASIEMGGEWGSETSSSVAVRTNFAVTPLWVGNAQVGADGVVTIPFDLPDNVGQYSVRAYVVGQQNSHGVGSTTFTARQPVASLEAKMPRIARLGDVFFGGVNVVMTDPTFRGPVNVTMVAMQASADGAATVLPLCNRAPTTITVNIASTGPAAALFPFCAEAQGQASMQFSVTVGESAVPADAVAHNITVLGWQEPVDLATSIALNASTANPWPEGVAFPSAVPNSGTLHIAVGTGYLPGVNALVQAIVNDNAQRESPLSLSEDSNRLWKRGRASSMDLVALLGASAALGEYGAATAEGNAAVSAVAQEAVSALSSYTSQTQGLLWFPPDGPITTPYGDAWLNAFALYMAERSSAATSLSEQWRLGLISALEEEATAATRDEGSFDNWNALAWAYLVLGTQHQFEAPEHALDNLLSNLGNTSLQTAVVASMALTRGNRGSDTMVTNTITRLANSFNVVGKTAYFAPESSSPDFTTNALALSFLAQRRANGISDNVPNLDKVAMYIAQEGRVEAESPISAYTVPLWQLSNSQRALAAIGLADYDAATGSTQPNMALSITMNDTAASTGAEKELLTAQFTADNLGDTAEATWSFGGLSNSTMRVFAQGTGEVTVITSMSFVPAAIPAQPINRGLGVTKAMYIADNASATGETAIGSQVVSPGMFVTVSLTVNSSDELRNVYVVDALPGSLEALDPNLYQSAAGNQPLEMRAQWTSLNPFQRVEVQMDKVTFYAPRLSQGQQVLNYTAIVVTGGAFTVPPAKAFCAEAPEIMGLTPGGWMMTSPRVVNIDPATRQTSRLTQPILPIATTA